MKAQFLLLFNVNLSQIATILEIWGQNRENLDINGGNVEIHVIRGKIGGNPYN